MSGWIVLAAVASIAVTAVLTLVLWRMNTPAAAEPREKSDKGDDGSSAYVFAPIIIGESSGRDANDNSSSDSGGGGDSGGGDGGGGGGGGGE